MNVNSLVSKAEMIREHIEHTKPDFVALSETWLTPDHGDPVIKTTCPDRKSSLQ